MQSEVLYESDWLGSEPVFYNTETHQASNNPLEVMPLGGLSDVHGEGLRNYLDFGYSVFQQTPIRNVKFLRHSSRLCRNTSGELKVEELDEPYKGSVGPVCSETEVIELVRERVQAWEKSLPSNQEIVLPLSGGYDSRLLLWCIKDRERIRAFTYGLSERQSSSFEVMIARQLAQKFGVRWERIPISDYHRLMDKWYQRYGVSVHTHGMYHLEFYEKIQEKLEGPAALLSGIFGDVWAGSISPISLSSADDLTRLGYTHGMRCDPSVARVADDSFLKESFWVDNRERLLEPDFQTLTTIRLKIILISYLMSLPRMYQLKAWTPFLDQDICTAMLNLPSARRKKRVWQQDFFSSEGLDFEKFGVPGTRRNNMGFQALRKAPLLPLSISVLGEVVDPSYVEWVNRATRLTCSNSFQYLIGTIPKFGGALRRLGMTPDAMRAYNSYLCLYPLERWLSGE